tara:strand:- start:280 stop:654 length:375 start_codon:yes stop_codon:yes gene_type:complete
LIKELDSYRLRILGLNPMWVRRKNIGGRLIVLVGDLTNDELYLVKRICFSINWKFGKNQTFIVESMPHWAKESDTVLDFVGLISSADNIIRLPSPDKILNRPSLKKRIWTELSRFLMENPVKNY